MINKKKNTAKKIKIVHDAARPQFEALVTDINASVCVCVSGSDCKKFHKFHQRRQSAGPPHPVAGDVACFFLGGRGVKFVCVVFFPPGSSDWNAFPLMAFSISGESHFKDSFFQQF